MNARIAEKSVRCIAEILLLFSGSCFNDIDCSWIGLQNGFILKKCRFGARVWLRLGFWCDSGKREFYSSLSFAIGAGTLRQSVIGVGVNAVAKVAGTSCEWKNAGMIN